MAKKDNLDRYIKIVEWSDEDNCYIGTCPELFDGGCHGDDPKAVFAELCEIVDETIEIYLKDGKPLPKPMASHDIIDALKKAA